MKKLGSEWILFAILASASALAGCGDDSSSETTGGGGTGGTAGTGGTPGATVSVGGIAWGFTLPGQGGYDRIVGAAISVLEMPELSTTSDENGAFTIEGVPVGSLATFVMEHERYPLTYTKTHTIPHERTRRSTAVSSSSTQARATTR